MKLLLIWIMALFVAPSGVHPKSQITFCELVRNPQKYNGQQVSIRATWRYGFEWSELYCFQCVDQGKAWLQIPSDLDAASVQSLKRAPKYAGIVNLTVGGIFVSGHTYGHENGYRYQIVADKISDVKVVQRGMKSREEEEKAEKQSACGGLDPK